MYTDGPGGAYYFWRGVNPAALTGLLAGCLTCVALLNPLSYASMRPYPYLTASLPSAAAGLVYFLSGLPIIRSGRGGYRR